VDYIRIEPTQYLSPEEMESFGCIKATNDFQPGLTNVADLTKSEDDLIAVMDYEMRRLNRQLDQRGFSFEVFYDVADMDDFLTMMQLTSSRAQAVFREADYLKTLIQTLGPTKHAGILYALNQGKRLSGVLFFDDHIGKTRYYMYAGSLDEARKVNGNAAALLHLFFDAKNIGLERFDFFGVSPIGDKNHRWAGFSKFKRDFGGVDMQFSGTWELPINKTRYKLMNRLRGLAKR
jgi:lipid II:glycine glycyltransferase (peptidoglycan interpeptide bridge formation enzyme)